MTATVTDTRALGEAGTTISRIGRSVRGNPSPYDRPETIEEATGLVTAAGGTGIPVRGDYTLTHLGCPCSYHPLKNIHHTNVKIGIRIGSEYLKT